MNIKESFKREQEAPAVNKPEICTINGHEWIDLGLSVKWATCNVGASSPSEFGHYFAWGETEPKSEYTWENYKFRISGKYAKAIFNKYNTGVENKQSGMVQMGDGVYWNMTSEEKHTSCGQGVVDNKTRLDISDDAARSNWGGSWRIPTREELDELITKCTWEQGIEGGNLGYRVSSKINGNSFFLPCSGEYLDNIILDRIGNYWSSSLMKDLPYNAYGINFGYSSCFEDDMIGWSSKPRSYGLSIRPVSE